MKTVLRLALLCSMLISGTAPAAPMLSSPVTPWNGEYMQAEQGAMYARFYLDGFRNTRGSKDLTNSIFMNMRNTKTGQIFALSQSSTVSGSDPVAVWKMPVGNYTVEKLSINENTGITRTFIPGGKRPTFSIRYMFLSNLGEIHLTPFQTKGLRVTFKSAANVFANPTSHQAFMGVLDGYKSTLQKRLGGSNLVKEAKDNFGGSNEVRAGYTTTRQISMLMQVDSSGSQQSRKLMSATISAQDAELRRCYMDQLDIAAGIRGSVSFKFQIAPNSGSFQALNFSGGSLNSPRAVECLSLALRKMQFPITKNMSGRLAFQFNYNDNPGRAKFP